MNDIEKIIIELNKRIQDAESQNQQMERRIKELEEQTNPLGIIEPGQEDFLVGGMINLDNIITVSNFKPGFLGGPTGISNENNNAKQWVIAKFPQATDKFQSFVSDGGGIGTKIKAEDPGINIFVEAKLYGIQEDFDIIAMDFNKAQALDIKELGVINSLFGGSGDEGSIVFAGGLSGLIDIGFSGKPDDGKTFFGVLARIEDSAHTGLIVTLNFSGGLGGGFNSIGFFTPNLSLS